MAAANRKDNDHENEICAVRNAAIVASTIAIGQQVSVNYNHSQSFASFTPMHGKSTIQIRIANSILAQVAQSDINNALSGKRPKQGEMSANPDLIVTASGGMKQQTSYSAWGMRGIGGGMGGITPEQNVEGTLVVSLYNAKEKALIWRGIGQGTLSNNGNKNQQRCKRRHQNVPAISLAAKSKR